MALQDVARALQRVESVLQRRPQAGLHDDAPATARWERDTRVTAIHANGIRLPTDMPTEFGGSGDQVSPGWLFRAGLASCAATCIVFRAASAAVELDELEIVASSRSDARGLLSMDGADGIAVSAATRDLELRIRIAARGVSGVQLRSLVIAGLEISPVYAALRGAVPIGVHIDPGVS
jgi:uncharacterized OsmC-like protein